VTVAQQQVDELRVFLDRQALVTVPDPGGVNSSPRRALLPLDVRQHVDARGPFEGRGHQSYYYVTGRGTRRGRLGARRAPGDFKLRRALGDLDARGLFPATSLHYQHLRRIDSKLRKSILFASASFVRRLGALREQMVVEAGFRRGDAAVRLGQLAGRSSGSAGGGRDPAHAEDLSVEQGHAILPRRGVFREGSARVRPSAAPSTRLTSCTRSAS